MKTELIDAFFQESKKIKQKISSALWNNIYFDKWNKNIDNLPFDP